MPCLRLPILALLLAPCLALSCSLSLFGDPPSDGGNADARDADAEVAPDAPDADAEPDVPDADAEPDGEDDGAGPVCGNGELEDGEECDDGNDIDTDACVSGCLTARCGDGHVYIGHEACDDADTDDTDACLQTCVEAACGDGHLHSGVEQCDDGNLAGDDGCESDCRFGCQTPADCDDDDPCTADLCDSVGTGMACRHTISAGLPCDDGDPCTDSTTCDAAGVCTGGTNTCDCTTTPECAPYEDGNPCNGTLICESNHCVVDPETIVTCDASGDGLCGANTCIAATGVCTMLYLPNGTECRAAAGPCDVAETCSGSSAACPRDDYRTIFTICRPAVTGGCDVAETCSGTAVDCPADAYLPAGTVCRPAATGGCDVAELCSGTSTTCPTNVYASPTVTCRASSGHCDPPEQCTGSHPTCPVDVHLADGAYCRTRTVPYQEGICCANTCEIGWQCCHTGNCRCGRPDRTQECGLLTTRTTCLAWPGCYWDSAINRCFGGQSACPFFPDQTRCTASPPGVCTWSSFGPICNTSHQCR